MVLIGAGLGIGLALATPSATNKDVLKELQKTQNSDPESVIKQDVNNGNPFAGTWKCIDYSAPSVIDTGTMEISFKPDYSVEMSWGTEKKVYWIKNEQAFLGTAEQRDSGEFSNELIGYLKDGLLYIVYGQRDPAETYIFINPETADKNPSPAGTWITVKEVNGQKIQLKFNPDFTCDMSNIPEKQVYWIDGQKIMMATPEQKTQGIVFASAEIQNSKLYLEFDWDQALKKAEEGQLLTAITKQRYMFERLEG
jgi:hypothetical protein